MASRTRLRNKVEENIAVFLVGGGTINQIDPDVTADPPKSRKTTTAAALSEVLAS